VAKRERAQKELDLGQVSKWGEEEKKKKKKKPFIKGGTLGRGKGKNW